jgi:hypothetical protein
MLLEGVSILKFSFIHQQELVNSLKFLPTEKHDERTFHH